MLFAGGDNNVEYQSQIADPVGMQGMAGATVLVGVVAHLSSALFAVQGFDGGVDIQDPEGAQCGLYAAQELGHKPSFTLLGAQAGQRAKGQSLTQDS